MINWFWDNEYLEVVQSSIKNKFNMAFMISQCYVDNKK